MIALPDQLPLLTHNGLYTTSFATSWLHTSLLTAARKAGYDEWWLADHITCSITRYLKNQFTGTILSTAHLDKTVRSVLHVLGYNEVASHFATSPPPVQISLACLAESAGPGFELLFFDLLQNEIHNLLKRNISHIQFNGLRYSTKFLINTKRWTKNCSLLRSEIVDFVRCVTQKSTSALTVTLR